MNLNELITEFFNQSGDEDYEYQLYRERQLEAEQEAYEQMLADKY